MPPQFAGAGILIIGITLLCLIVIRLADGYWPLNRGVNTLLAAGWLIQSAASAERGDWVGALMVGTLACAYAYRVGVQTEQRRQRDRHPSTRKDDTP